MGWIRHHWGRGIWTHDGRAIDRREALWLLRNRLGAERPVWVHVRKGWRPDGAHLDALSTQDIVEIFSTKARYLAFDESLALCKLMFEAFCVASGGESLTVAVFLVAFCASS